jgi:hypothetical protein
MEWGTPRQRVRRGEGLVVFGSELAGEGNQLSSRSNG